jgi:hypothetical protein
MKIDTQKQWFEEKCICGKYYPLKDEPIIHLSWCPQSIEYDIYKERYRKANWFKRLFLQNPLKNS